MKRIKIKYFSNEIDKLDYIDGKSDWIDLRSAEHIVLKKGEFKAIPLDLYSVPVYGVRLIKKMQSKNMKLEKKD